MPMQARRLVLNGDSREDRLIFARIYDGLLGGWSRDRASEMRHFTRILDALQGISVLRPLTPEQESALRQQAAAGGQEWEQSEHDRLLKPGEQVLLMAEGDFLRLKQAFEKIETWPTASSRSIEAARKVLESVPLADIRESG